jgi:hypothetical protein
MNPRKFYSNEEAGDPQVKVYEPASSVQYLPRVHGMTEGGFWIQPTPGLTLMKMSEATVTEGSDVLANDNFVIFDKATRATSEKTIYHDCDLASLSIAERTLVLRDRHPVAKLKRAFTLLGVYSGHWGHFFTERILTLTAVLPYLPPDTIILVSNKLDPVARASLQVLINKIGKGHKIAFVGEKASVHVEELYYASQPVLMTNDSQWVSIYDFVIQWFGHVVQKTLTDCLSIPESGVKKVFFTRPITSSKSCSNIVEVEEFFAAKGYFIFRPEKLNFEERRKILGSCDEFAGLYGSAFANLTFSKNVRKAVILAPFVRCVEQTLQNLRRPDFFEYFPVSALDSHPHPRLRIDIPVLRSYDF